MTKNTCVDGHTFKLDTNNNRNVNDIESTSKELIKCETELNPWFFQC